MASIPGLRFMCLSLLIYVLLSTGAEAEKTRKGGEVVDPGQGEDPEQGGDGAGQGEGDGAGEGEGDGAGEGEGQGDGETPGQGGDRPGQGGGGGQVGNRPDQGNGGRPGEQEEKENMICGPNTSDELLDALDDALYNATDWVLSQRTRDWGWPLRNTAAAIAFLQLTDKSWLEDLTVQLSVKQLQIELLGHLLEMFHKKAMMSSDMDKGGMDMGMGMGMGMGVDRDMKNSTNSSDHGGRMDMDHMNKNSTNSSDYGGRNMTRDGEMSPDTAALLPYYLIALRLTCHNVSDFYGVDLVGMLKRHLAEFSKGGRDSDYFQYALGLVALCHTGADIDPDHVAHLLEGGLPQNNAFLNGPPDMASMVLMAMSCIREKVSETHRAQLERVMSRVSDFLRRNQDGGGKVGRDSVSTALAAQALMAAGGSPTKWNCEGAVRYVLKEQSKEGDFGSLGLTLRVLPLLAHSSLVSMGNMEDMRMRCHHQGYGMGEEMGMGDREMGMGDREMGDREMGDRPEMPDPSRR